MAIYIFKTFDLGLWLAFKNVKRRMSRAVRRY